MPSLGDAFGRREPRRRVDAPYEADNDNAASEPTYDPYEQPIRSRPTRQRRALPVDDYGDDGWDAQAEPVRARRYPGRPREGRRRETHGRQIKAPNMGAAVQFANQFERPVLITIGVGVVSLVLMVATIAARQGSLAKWFPIHLNAAGTPDKWGSPATLWRLPLMVVMVTLMSAVLAWFASKRDPFAAQFVLASTILIQVLCWIAVINLAW